MGRLRNYFLNHYPRTDFHELNQDWMISMLFDMINQVENFVEMNSVKYADPIQWDITRQYEKNTIVIDEITGTAYISSKPVPKGVALSRTEYWNVIFDIGRFITLASQNFANSYEALVTTTATMPTDQDKWVVWNSILYRAKNDIHVGDMYVIDGNIEKYTVEMFFDELAHLIAEETEARIEADNVLHGEIVDESVARENADTTLQDNIDAEAVARENADTTLQGNIDAEATARENADTTLQGNIDAEATARENSDNVINAKIGNLSNLTTSDKTNIVNAINDVNSRVSGLFDKADIRSYGGVADGTTDCTSAFNACMNENNLVYMPNYNNQAYVLGGVTLNDGMSVIGTEGTIINSTASNLFTIIGNNVDVRNLIVNTPNNMFYINSNSKSLSFIHIENVYSYGANRFLYDNDNASYTYTNLYVNRCAARQHKSFGVDLAKCYAFLIMEDVTIDCVGQTGVNSCFRLRNNAGCQLTRCEAEGGFTDGSHAGHGGFDFSNSQAIWLNRCMADTVDGTGFNFYNCQYVYMFSCAASLCGSHGIAILSNTCYNFLISNSMLIGRRGLGIVPGGAHGIYNFNDYIQINNCEISNFSGYAIADNASGTHNIFNSINIVNCDRSFVSSSGGGIISAMNSSIADVPTFGNYKHRLVVANNVLYDSPLGV